MAEPVPLASRHVGFSPDHYQETLQAAIDAGYRLLSLRQYYDEPSLPVVLLRHDIDRRIDLAVETAKIESGLGVRSTFYFRVHAANYNLFARTNYQLLAWLRDEGFHIGLHHEVGHFPFGDSAPREALRREITILQTILERPVDSATIHLPKRSRHLIKPADLEALGILFDGGDRVFNEGATFISDSNRQLKPACLCQLIGTSPKLYFLTHPLWWMSPRRNAEELRDALVSGE